MTVIRPCVFSLNTNMHFPTTSQLHVCTSLPVTFYMSCWDFRALNTCSDERLTTHFIFYSELIGLSYIA